MVSSVANLRRQDSRRISSDDMKSSKYMGLYFVQMPPGERKSGMPDSVEMPAPVKATMRLAEPIASCRRSMSSMSPPPPYSSGCRHAGIVRRAADQGAALAPDLDGIGE